MYEYYWLPIDNIFCDCFFQLLNYSQKPKFLILNFTMISHQKHNTPVTNKKQIIKM